MDDPAADGGLPPLPDAAPEAVSMTGLVEGLQGGFVTGWAIDPERGGHAAIRVTDAAGETVAEGVAARLRTDLAAYGYGRCDFGFRLAVPALGASKRLHVYADGAELSGSPLQTGAGLWDGAVAVLDGWAEGWVHERRAGFAPPLIRLLDQDGRCLGETRAIEAAEFDGVFRPAWFYLQLPVAAWASPELQLRVEADGVIAARSVARLTLQGALEQADSDFVGGYLGSPEAPGMRFGIEVYRDRVLVGSGMADAVRSDLALATGCAPEWGFGFALRPPPAPPDRPSVLSIRLAESGAELFGGPFVTGAARHFVAPARRVAASWRRAGLDAVERSVLEQAAALYLASCRADPDATTVQALQPPPRPAGRVRFSVIIPVYRDVAVTQACLESVLAHRDPAREAVVLIDDASPEPEMAALLAEAARQDNVFVLTNPANLGFVQSVNRGLGFCRDGDVILLNSDTRVFAGGLHALWACAAADETIGTATALSNNATIFSYPVSDLGCSELDDISWAEVAAIALARNQGRAFDVPTGHGFCLLIRRAVLDRLGGFDPAYGRGYGEENDFCQRAADLGFRNVVAAAAFVEHRESVSFTSEKRALLRRNLQRLERRFAEYAPLVRESVARDDVRGARWAIDAARLARARAGGASFVLVLRNWLEGGTRQAIVDIEHAIGFGGATVLDLCARADGAMRLSCGVPRVQAVFAAGEHAALFTLLDAAGVSAIAVHQLLGFDADFAAALAAWRGTRHARYYVHDFYPLCPRVTMIDALGRFCDIAPAAQCERCVAMDGTHDAHRMTGLGVAEQRALFARLLAGFDEVVAPSANAAGYVRRGLGVDARVSPHPERVPASPVLRAGAPGAVALLGAIGPHKGSGTLLAVARRARLEAPELRFHVIGHTACDEELRRTGNVTVTGPYTPSALGRLVAASGARIALFLQGWPETYSYTLSEAWRLGLAPLVPDIGAPADRVRAMGFGRVFGFPIDPGEVVALLRGIAEGRIDPRGGAA